MKLFKLEYDVNNYRQLNWSSDDVDIIKISRSLLPNSNESHKLTDIKWMVEKGVTDLPKPDVAYLQGYIPSIIANEKSYEVLRKILGNVVDIERANIEGEPWYVFRIKSYTNSLLLEKSQFKVRRSGGIGRLLKGVYDGELLKNVPVSICEQDPLNIIVNESFVAEVESNGITGLNFRPV